jgi:hypothetical protein
MAKMTPERADRALERAVDLMQLIAILGALFGVGGAVELIGDGEMVGWSVAAGVLILAVLGNVVACWARAWRMRP